MTEYNMMFSPDDFYRASVTIKCNLNKWVKKIQEKLIELQLELFRKSCFGHFLDAKELNFSESLVTQMLWCQCHDNDINVMEFAFGTSGTRSMIYEFLLIRGLCCGPIPKDTYSSRRVTHSTYFGGSSIVKNEHIIRAFEEVTCTDDENMLKLALIYFLELVVLKSLESMHDMPRKRGNNSHSYTLVGFSLAFILLEFESIPAFLPIFGIGDKVILYPQLLN